MKNHRRSVVKRARKSGFRARMKKKSGRKMLNKRRSQGRRTNVRAEF